MKYAKLAAAVAALIASSSVGATTWTGYNTVEAAGSTFLAAGTSIYCATTNNTTSTCQTTTSGLTGSIVKLTAYSTSGTVAGASTSPQDTSNWITAQMRIYGGGGGIAIANTVQTAPTETTSPQHAIDNFGLNDILVVDFGWQDGSSNWDVSQFTLGYMCQMDGAGACSTPNTTGTQINVDAWLGGNGSTVFGGASGIHFAANNTSNIGLTPGFTRLPLTNDETVISTRADQSANPQPLGRYLVITGDLNSYQDAFKITGISASQVTNNPPGTVPAPGSVSLIALALLALTWMYRRRPVAARAR